MPSLKTAYFDRLLNALQYGLNNLRQSLNLLIGISDIDTSLFHRLEKPSKRYPCANASISVPRNMADNVLLDISISDDDSPITRNIWKPASPTDRPYEKEFQQYLIAFGNTSFANMVGKEIWSSHENIQHRCYLSRAKHSISVVRVGGILCIFQEKN